MLVPAGSISSFRKSGFVLVPPIVILVPENCIFIIFCKSKVPDVRLAVPVIKKSVLAASPRNLNVPPLSVN